MTQHGLIYHIPFDDYRAIPAINSSSLKKGLISPKHMHASLSGDLEDKDTPAKTLGRLIHCATLEPDRFAELQSLPQCNGLTGKKEQCKRTAAYKSEHGFFCDQHSQGVTRVPIEGGSASDLERARLAAESIHSTDIGRLLSGEGGPEVTALWSYGGLDCKCRYDFLNLDGSQPLILDIKKVRAEEATKKECERAVRYWGYHIQAAFYVESLRRLYGADAQFMWIFVEDNPPFDVMPLLASKETLETGMVAASALLDRYAECLESGVFPGAWNPSDGVAVDECFGRGFEDESFGEWDE